MDLKFRVFAHVSRPLHTVFEAVVDPIELSSYFTTGGAKGRIEPGVTVSWDFHDFPGRFPVDVLEVVRDRRIVLQWDAHEVDGPVGQKTRVTMEFTSLDNERARWSASWRKDGARIRPVSMHPMAIAWAGRRCLPR